MAPAHRATHCKPHHRRYLIMSLSLFEEFPVTEQDVKDWLDTVPNNLSANESRRQAYRKAYQVDDKIRSAKRAGNWPLTDQI